METAEKDRKITNLKNIFLMAAAAAFVIDSVIVWIFLINA